MTLGLSSWDLYLAESVALRAHTGRAKIEFRILERVVTVPACRVDRHRSPSEFKPTAPEITLRTLEQADTNRRGRAAYVYKPP